MRSSNKADRRKAWEAITRDAIVEAVVRLVGRNGVQDVTMETVANEAGVAKGTLYIYFKDKQDLLRSTMNASLSPLRKRVDELLEGDLPPKDKLQKFVNLNLHFFDEHRHLFRILLYDRQFMPSHYKRYGTERYRYLIRKLSEVLGEGMAAGQFKPLDAYRLAGILLEANFAVISDRLLSDAPTITVEQDTCMLISVFFNGILADPDLEKNI